VDKVVVAMFQKRSAPYLTLLTMYTLVTSFALFSASVMSGENDSLLRTDGIYKSNAYSGESFRYFKFSETGEYLRRGTSDKTDFGAYEDLRKRQGSFRGKYLQEKCKDEGLTCSRLIPDLKQQMWECPLKYIPCSDFSKFRLPVPQQVLVFPDGTFSTEGLTFTFIGTPEKTATYRSQMKSDTSTADSRSEPRESSIQCDVAKAQAVLTDLGFNPGPVDGQWGRKTSNAILKYQQQNDLKVTGQLGESVCNSLGLSTP
jgi:hypothetical protein